MGSTIKTRLVFLFSAIVLMICGAGWLAVVSLARSNRAMWMALSLSPRLRRAAHSANAVPIGAVGRTLMPAGVGDFSCAMTANDNMQDTAFRRAS